MAVIFALGVVLRTYRLNSSPPGLLFDEAVDGNDGLRAWRTGDYRVFYESNAGREGLMINFQGLALGLWAPTEVWVLRLPAALLGSLTVLGVYLVGRQTLPGNAGLWAAFFLATSFWQINVSRIGTRPVAAPFFFVWTWYLMERARSGWSALAAGTVWGLGFYTYPNFRITPVMFLSQLRRAGKRLVPVVLVALIVAAPLAVFAVRHRSAFSRRINQVSVLNSATPLRDMARNATKTAGMFFFAGDQSPRHNLPGAPMLFWPVAVLFACGLWVVARGHRPLLWSLAVAALPAIAANEGVPHALRASLMAPVVFLITGLGAEWAASKLPAIWLPSAKAVLVLGLTGQAYWTYFERWARDARVATAYDQFLLPVAQKLESLPRELPKYVIFKDEKITEDGFLLCAQSLMFLTDTASPERQAAMNLHYLTSDQTNQIARGVVYVHLIETADQ